MKVHNKIKLLLIAPDFDYSNGVTRHLRILLRLLADSEGFEIHFLTNRGDAIAELDTVKNIFYKVFPFSNNKFYLNRHFNFFRYLKNYCEENKIDIIHTHHRYPEIISVLVAKRLKLKTVTTAHSLVKGVKPFSFKSDLIIAVSNRVKNHIIRKFNVAQSKVVKIYNCISDADYKSDITSLDEIRRELNISHKDFVIFFNGRIGKTKGTDLLVSAFKLFSQSYHNLKLILVGAAESPDVIKALPKNVILFHPQKNISKYYLISEVIILPSRTESFPYVMLEAGLFNKPFIGAKVDGIAEFIEDGVDGLLFNCDDEKNLLQKLKYAYENTDRMQEMAKHLNKKVETNCNCGIYLSKLKSLYYHLLSS